MANPRRPIVPISMIGLLMDHLLLYMPGIEDGACFKFNRIFGIAACILLTVFDLYYLIFTLDYGLKECRREQKERRKFFFLLFQVVSILPIAQMTLGTMMKGNNYKDQDSGSLTQWIVLYVSLLFKHVRRLFPVLRWSRKAITSRKLADWSLMFCICNLYFSQLYGAYWYFLAVYKQFDCWNVVCGDESEPDECFYNLFTCKNKPETVTKLWDYCLEFKYYGIDQEAIHEGFLDARVFPLLKIFYCFRQGLQNLSSFGQNLDVGTDLIANIYAILVTVFGILSFSFLLGMIQIYQQSSIKRFAVKEKKREERKQWLTSQKLSEEIQLEIKKYTFDNWQETKVVNLKNMFDNLPEDLRRKLTRELCLKMLYEVAEFRRWRGEASLEELCNYVKPVLYVERTRIIQEGDPIDEIIFVVQGNLWTYTSTGKKTGSSRTGRFNYSHRNGHIEISDFFGEELVNWIQADPYTTDLPVSTKTIQAVTDVEASVLMAYDLKNIFIKLHAVNFV